MVGHFTGGEPLRAVLPKLLDTRRKRRMEKEDKNDLLSSYEDDAGKVAGYGLQLTWDVPQGKHNGVLDVRVCWHDILAQFNFGMKGLAF